MIRLEVLTDLASVERLLPEWRALTHAAARSAFEAADWQLPLARHYLAGYGVRFLAWRDEAGELVAVAPLSVIGDRPPLRPVRLLALWGSIGPRMRGLVDVVARDDVRAEVLDSFVDWLRAERHWDALRILRPQFESATPARLRRAAQQAGWSYIGYQNPRSTTYQVELPADAEGWERHLSSRKRKTMRWEARKFAELGGEVVPAVGDAELAAALEAGERLLRERWGDGEVYFVPDPRYRRLVHEAIPALVANGDAWVSVARDANGIQGVLVNVAQHGYGVALMIAMSTNETYAPFSLGKHLFDVGLGEAVRRGCHNYDFLWVGGYKETFWHAEPRLLESAFIGRGLIGRPFARILARRDRR